jgi:DnaJ-class molecular chaperone
VKAKGTCAAAQRATSTCTSIASHAFFECDGADLHCRVPISMVTAALGGEFEVPTIAGGKTRMKEPEGTQSGRRFRLKGKGMPVLRSRQTGDMYVEVVVETPQKLTRRQCELLREFEKLSSRDTRPEFTRSIRRPRAIRDRSFACSHRAQEASRDRRQGQTKRQNHTSSDLTRFRAFLSNHQIGCTLEHQRSAS